VNGNITAASIFIVSRLFSKNLPKKNEADLPACLRKQQGDCHKKEKVGGLIGHWEAV
jgi:hypothetical protein